ncbi:GvpL/GvpF family gas vesicle protein [Kibdelosporangium aridum]|uniref:GvpL/GvpF family gas vesicle protein n=1 Tax=Kibdelosporangium aridum TaxID=2030 RepID=UPI0035E8F576
MRLRLHGVVRAAHPVPTGVRLVTWEDLAVVVSEVPDDRSLGVDDAMAHLQMLCGMVTNGPVVPLRFGTFADDEAAIPVEVLKPSATTLRGHLDRLDGLVEVHVYLRSPQWGEDALAPVAALARESVSLPGTARRAFLLPLADVETARAAVAGHAAEFVAPLPAYSFLAPAAASRWGW